MSMTNEELEEALSKALKRITALEKKAAAQHLRLSYLENKGLPPGICVSHVADSE